MNEVKKAKRLWLLREMFCLAMVSVGILLSIGSHHFMAKSGVIGLLAYLLFYFSAGGALFFLLGSIGGLSIRSEEIEGAELIREKNIKDALVCIANENLKGKEDKNEILS